MVPSFETIRTVVISTTSLVVTLGICPRVMLPALMCSFFVRVWITLMNFPERIDICTRLLTSFLLVRMSTTFGSAIHRFILHQIVVRKVMTMFTLWFVVEINPSAPLKNGMIRVVVVVGGIAVLCIFRSQVPSNSVWLFHVHRFAVRVKYYMITIYFVRNYYWRHPH